MSLDRPLGTSRGAMLPNLWQVTATGLAPLRYLYNPVLPDNERQPYLRVAKR